MLNSYFLYVDVQEFRDTKEIFTIPDINVNIRYRPQAVSSEADVTFKIETLLSVSHTEGCIFPVVV
jgi:hypothetical protein